MIRISNIKIKPNEDKNAILVKGCKKIRVSAESVKEWSIVKESLDARNKNNIFFIYTIDVRVNNEDKILKSSKSNDVSKGAVIDYVFPNENINKDTRPIVVGFGPAGMFAALSLCQMGFSPIVLERGNDVDERVKNVEAFWQTGKLMVSSNVQFGEGGAGTFSDGKLTYRSKNPRCGKVFFEFVKAGAPEDILYSYNPHIGTDKLREVVKNIREEIKRLGGEIRFGAQLTDVVVENGAIKAVVINNEEEMKCSDVLLAIGHSARDTFEMLNDRKVALEQKAFAVGARIEHLQESINKAQYGEHFKEERLKTAEYKLVYTTKKGRGVYTFCMCPGGQVVAAASENEALAVNGMSYHARAEKNANSAVLVQIEPKDFETSNPLAGMFFQRELEKKAYIMGGNNYFAPCQKVGDFLCNKESTAFGEVLSSYTPGVKFCDLNQLFPEFMVEALKEAIVEMGKRLKGFDCDDAILTAVESRSSSPIRITRDLTTGESVGIKGLYPLGEGAGYAGGIVSAAVDGIMVAEKILEKYKI